MIIYVDIDNCICFTPTPDYEKCTPHVDRIAKINKLFDEGHTIVYWTARGSTTRLPWEDLTKKQLSDWGAKYHELKLRKPYYDLFIDDRNVNSEEFFK